MATVYVNLPQTGDAGRSEQEAPETRHRSGWSVFLCDDEGNLSAGSGEVSGPFPAGNGYLEVRGVPPGRRLLFARR